MTFLLGLAELTVSMSAVILLALLLSKLFGKRLTSSCRYLVWIVILIRMCIPVGTVSLPPLFSISVPVEDMQISESGGSPDSGEAVTEPLPPAETDTNTDAVPTVPTQPSEPVQPNIPNSPDAGTETAFSFTWDKLGELALAVWALGAVLYFGTVFTGSLITTHGYSNLKTHCPKELRLRYTAMCRRMKIKRPPRLYLSKYACSPILYGFLSPTVLLPAVDLPLESLEHALAHELTHYRRGDILVKLIILIAESVNWFNPLVHIAAKRCCSEMEFSCDDSVLRECDEDERRAYGMSMLEIIRNVNGKRAVLSTGFNPQKNAVTGRVMNILDTKKKSKGRSVVALALVLCITAGSAVSLNFKANAGQLTPEYYYLSTDPAKPPEYNNAIFTFEKFLREEINACDPDGREVLLNGVFGINGDNVISSYALFDVDGDGVPELHTRDTFHRVFAYRDGKVILRYASAVNIQHGSTVILENGALFSRQSTTGVCYTYTVFYPDNSYRETVVWDFYWEFDENVLPYYFLNGEQVKCSQTEYEELVDRIEAESERTASVEWLQYERRSGDGTEDQPYITYINGLQKIINAPRIYQKDAYPNGCESVSTVMALGYWGFDISVDEFIDRYLDMGPVPTVGGKGPDPSLVFCGDPRLRSGWGCYASVIVNALNKFVDPEEYTVEALYGVSLTELCRKYIDNDIPVIIWATDGMGSYSDDKYYASWTTEEGKNIRYNRKLHCLLLVGYDDRAYYVNDPLYSNGDEICFIGYSKESCEEAYSILGQQCVVIAPTKP